MRESPPAEDVVWLFMLTLPRFAPAVCLFRRFPNHTDLSRGLRGLALKLDSRAVDTFVRAAIPDRALAMIPEKLETLAKALKAPVLTQTMKDGTVLMFQRCVVQPGGAVELVMPEEA